MKKILVALIVLMSLAVTSQAQFLNWGVRGGAGIGLHSDDMATCSPVLAANVGAFVSFGFTQSQSLAADNFVLQTGLNIIRRGTHFREVLEKGMSMSVREGYYAAYYVQLPILATIRYELPLRDPGHRVLFSVGPAVSYGLFGDYIDRKISPGMPQYTWNYEIDKDAFTVLNRMDVNVLLGVGYEWKDLSVMLQFDLGLLAVTKTEDFLKSSEMQSFKANYVREKMPDEDILAQMTPDVLQNQIEQLEAAAEEAAKKAFQGVNMYVPGGNNFALMLTVGYQFPIR